MIPYVNEPLNHFLVRRLRHREVLALTKMRRLHRFDVEALARDICSVNVIGDDTINGFCAAINLQGAREYHGRCGTMNAIFNPDKNKT
jgi:hypothetical protein